MFNAIESLDFAKSRDLIFVENQFLQILEGAKLFNSFKSGLIGLLHIQKNKLSHFFDLLFINILDIAEVISAKYQLLDCAFKCLTNLK